MIADAVALARELIRFDTINPPGQEKPCAEHLARKLEAAGFRCVFVEMGEGRANLIARIGGAPDRPPLAFTGHVDVVPLGARVWSVAPFGGETGNGKVFGRGASDMKSGVAAFVAAAIDLAPRLATSPGVVLVVTAGEETGCEGAFHMARTAGNVLGQAGALVVAEPTSNRPLVGHRGALWLKAATKGVTAHGSMPDRGVNAVYKAARSISRLADFDFNVSRHPVLGSPTLNVGWVHGGMNINSVPDLAEFGIDIRTIPAQRHGAVKDLLARFVGEEVELSALMDVAGVWTEPGHAWMQAVFATVRAVTGAEPAIGAAPFFTDASVLAPALGGIPTVILCPGPTDMAHQTDEFCEIARIEEAVEINRRLIAGWCGL
jgi:succinyl-diaminopimelate desuccinylase